MPGDDWKSKLKDAWNKYGADIVAGGAGALGGWFLPHLFWDNPSYVNKGASAALLAAISIAGQRGIKDALKGQPKAPKHQKYVSQLKGAGEGVLKAVQGQDQAKYDYKQQGKQAQDAAYRFMKPLADRSLAGHVTLATGGALAQPFVRQPLWEAVYKSVMGKPKTVKALTRKQLKDIARGSVLKKMRARTRGVGPWVSNKLQARLKAGFPWLFNPKVRPSGHKRNMLANIAIAQLAPSVWNYLFGDDVSPQTLENK